MMGLMVLAFLIVYLKLSIFVTKKAIGWAKTHNQKPWVWGGLAAFMMYNLVFWDLIPTLVAHKYYCETQAGFWVYKTPEQWMKENPEIHMTELSNHIYAGTDNDYISTETMNQRLNYVRKLNPVSFWLPLYKTEEYFEDTETKQILIQRKNYLSGYRERNGIGQLKVWMSSESCDKGNKTLHAFGLIEEKFRKINNEDHK